MSHLVTTITTLNAMVERDLLHQKDTLYQVRNQANSTQLAVGGLVCCVAILLFLCFVNFGLLFTCSFLKLL